MEEWQEPEFKKLQRYKKNQETLLGLVKKRFLLFEVKFETDPLLFEPRIPAALGYTGSRLNWRLQIVLLVVS